MAREIHKEYVAVGFADVYTAPGETTAPLDTIGFGEATAPWTSIGATEDGVTKTYGKTTTEHRIEEDPLPAILTVESATFSLGFSLAEDTLESIALAYGGTISGTTVRRLALSLTLTELAVLFESPLPDGGFRRIYIPRVLSVGEVATSYRRSESKRLYPVTLQSVCGIDEIDIADHPDAALFAAAAPQQAGGEGQQAAHAEGGAQEEHAEGGAQAQQGASQQENVPAGAGVQQ